MFHALYHLLENHLSPSRIRSFSQLFGQLNGMESPRQRRKTWDRKQCKGAEGGQQQKQTLKKWPWTAASHGGLPGYILAGDLRSVRCPRTYQWEFLYPPSASSLLLLLQPSTLSTHLPLTDLLKHEWEHDPFKASWVTIRRNFLLCFYLLFLPSQPIYCYDLCFSSGPTTFSLPDPLLPLGPPLPGLSTHLSLLSLTSSSPVDMCIGWVFDIQGRIVTVLMGTPLRCCVF